MNKEFFRDRTDNFREKHKEVKKKADTYSILRLISFLLIIPAIMLNAQLGLYIGLGLALLLLVLFIYFVSKHTDLKNEELILNNLREINELETKVYDHEFSAYPDGREHISPAHGYSFDMDIFGPYSIFQYINRTCTLSGAKQLAQVLGKLLSRKSDIQDRQKMFQELSEKLEFRQNFQAQGMSIAESKEEHSWLMTWMKEEAVFLKNTFIQIARFAFPLLILIVIVLSFFITKFTGLIAVLFLVNLAVVGAFIRQTAKIHALVGDKSKLLKKYLKLIHEINSASFSHPELIRLQKTTLQAGDAIKNLSKIIDRIDARLNLLVGIILNGLFLYDFHVITALEKWKSKHQDDLQEWLDVIFEFDAMNSIANYTHTHPHFIFPEISDEKKVSVEAIGHPLIRPNECITNDVSLGESEKLIILTGANMSGKSTFLRALGVNAIFALIGGPVYASKFSIPIMDIRTSMRLTDSLNERASYFYAELKRLQSITQELESGKSILIILDEILKGTNSEDKLSGSQDLIRKFTEYNSLGIIATHDLELGKLEEEMPKEISNYCFESTIADDELSFDYTLRKGLAQNKNATFLMKQMEII